MVAPVRFWRFATLGLKHPREFECAWFVVQIADPDADRGIGGQFADRPAQITAVNFGVDTLFEQPVTNQLGIDDIFRNVDLDHTG